MEERQEIYYIEKKKNWKSYAWEFIMLFFAVFCGFIANYLLGNMVDRDKEKQYIQLLVDDLAADTTNLAVSINKFNIQDLNIDTTLTQFGTLTDGHNDTLINNLIQSVKIVNFINTDRTMQQLKSSGELRLIIKQRSAKGIMDYDSKMKQLMNVNLPILRDVVLQNLVPDMIKIVNFQQIIYDYKNKTYEQRLKENKNYLIASSKKELIVLYNLLYSFRQTCNVTKNDEVELKKQATQLIKLLKQEYEL